LSASSSRGANATKRSRPRDGQRHHWIASLTLAMTASDRHTLAFPRRDSRARVMHLPALEEEGAGNAGCLSQHPRPHVQKKKHMSFWSPQVLPSHRHSPRDGFTAYSALSLVNRALLPPWQATMREHRRRLDASIGAPGPHDFAVRLNCCSSDRAKASIASRTQRS